MGAWLHLVHAVLALVDHVGLGPAASASPMLACIWATMLRLASLILMASGSSWMIGARPLMASSGSKTAGRISYSTSMASMAFWHSSGVSAATIATRSPTWRTLLSRLT